LTFCCLSKVAYKVKKHAVCQHIQIIHKNDIGVNHFLAQSRFDLPNLLGQFFALDLDGLDTSVSDSSNARKAHCGHNQA
jgi:hypothetical protein